MPKRITEAQTLTVTESSTPGRVRLQLIDSGWGSSGYYSPQVLENAANEQVFPAGTHVFFDHPSESERLDRPERSVRDLAMVLDEDATYDPGTHALVSEAKVIGPYKELVTDPTFMEAVGMSIRATGDSTIGEAEGRKGTLITQLVEGVSVDLVTRAGRGGRILAAVESARAGLREASTNETREALYVAIKAAYGAEDTYTWVRDFDPAQSLVYFDIDDEDSMHTYQQSYDIGEDGTATLTDQPVEVRITTSYVPVVPDDSTDDVGESTPNVPAPAGQSAANESQGDDMATTQIEESQLATLRQDAERVPTLESERDTAQRERDEAREALAERDRIDAARVIIATQARESGITFTDLEERGLLVGLPVTESGDLDQDAYTTSVTEAATEKSEQNGAGRVTGFGATTSTDKVEESADDAVAAAFGRTITKEA